jgi:glycine cleavage system transcriptional repressor
VVGGYFTLIMIVSLPRALTPEELAERIRGTESTESAYQVTVRAGRSSAKFEAGEASDRFVMTAFGADQPGIVRRFSQYLAGKDINIVDLYGDRRRGEFVLVGQLEIPTRWDVRMLQADLEQMAAELEFTVKLQHENVFVATNQLRFSSSLQSQPAHASH